MLKHRRHRTLAPIALTAATLTITFSPAELRPVSALPPTPAPTPARTPSPAALVPSGYRVRTLANNLDHPWDVAFRPNGSMFVTERGGWIGLLRRGRYRRIHRPVDVAVNGEGGMLGITVSPRFARNRELFVCFNTSRDVRVVRFKFAGRPARLIGRRNLVTGIPTNPSGSGRHSGCRLKFGHDGFLWVTTGDAAVGTNPQNLNSLGGKVLRVTNAARRPPATSAVASSPTASATRRASPSAAATAGPSSSSTDRAATTRSRPCAGARTAGGTRSAAASTTRASR